LDIYKENEKNIFINEIENLRKNMDNYKKFYDEEINNSKNIVLKLSILIEDILLNFKKDPNSKINNENNQLINYYMSKAKNILVNDKNDCNFNTITEGFFNEGFASKKLDYVLIDLIQKNENNTPSIIYGSGLDKQVPTKCPLYKNLKYAPEGDNLTEFSQYSD